jgi:hypothetical protein
MKYRVSCRDSFEFWSNVLPSSTGRLDLTEEIVRTRWEASCCSETSFVAVPDPGARFFTDSILCVCDSLTDNVWRGV